jgi:WD40 repeat protein
MFSNLQLDQSRPDHFFRLEFCAGCETVWYLAVADIENHICVWKIDAFSPKNQSRLEYEFTHSGKPQTSSAIIWSVEFSPDGQYLATGGGDATVRIWSVQFGQEARRVILRQAVTGLAYSPDGRWLAAAVLTGKVYLLDQGLP